MSNPQEHDGDSRDPSDIPANNHASARPTVTSNGVKRKRATGTSSRGVANLTPEQLERKRANDREAQRAIRERTKNQIESLNREIEELKSQQPYLDLQAALRQKDAIRAENEELKRRIFSFVTSIQPFLTSDGPPQGLTELAAAAERNAITLQQSAGAQILQESPYPPGSLQDVNSPGTGVAVSSPDSQTSLTRHPSIGPSNHIRSWQSSSDPGVRNIHPDLAYNHYDERMGVDFLLENNRPKLANGLAQNNGIEALSPYTALPRNTEATNTLDAILLSFRQEHQRLFQSGAPSSQVSGPLYPNFNALLNPNTTIPSHPLSKVMIDILRTFPDLSKLPEQVAVMYIMFLVMRWQIEPTRANYELLPDWVTPRPSQLFTPHPHWLDHLPFPRLRDACVQQTTPVIFDNFFVPFTTTLSLNWPYDPADVLVPRPPANLATIVAGPDGEEQVYSINPAFETHLRRLENWSLGSAFAEAFPEWKELVKIRDR